jgi:hypothetical protein
VQRNPAPVPLLTPVFVTEKATQRIELLFDVFRYAKGGIKGKKKFRL